MKAKESINPKYKQLLLDIISKHLPDAKIYLFGSRARQTHQEGADVDLAIDSGKSLSLTLLAKIKSDIDDSPLPLLVDIVDIQSTDADFITHIKKEWILWKN